MKLYTVRSGQNLYDVALTLYGSIEGIFDLLISNDDISLNSNLKHGQVLNYNEEFMIEQSIPDWFKSHDIVVKNGCHPFENTNVLDLISNFVKSQNEIVARKFKNGELSFNFDMPEPTKKFTFWEDENGNFIYIPQQESKIDRGIFASGSKTEYWDNTTVSDEVIRDKDLRKKILASISVDIGDDFHSDYALVMNLNPVFTAGMILLPLLDYDKKEFFSQLATPKIIVNQSGNNSSFGVQLPSNKLSIVDWGDDTDFTYVWFNQHRQDISHRYSGNGNHIIKIYGSNEFVNLDFSNLNGVYNLLENIYIERMFVTPYPNAEKLNRLFIIKQDDNE